MSIAGIVAGLYPVELSSLATRALVAQKLCTHSYNLKDSRLPVSGRVYWFRDGSRLRLIGYALIVDDSFANDVEISL